MNINWRVRIKNKAFWLALIPAVLLLVQVVAAVFGYTLDLGDLGNKLACRCQCGVCRAVDPRHCDRPDHGGHRRQPAGDDLRRAQTEPL